MEARKRVKHPSLKRNVGDEINVKVLKFDPRARLRIPFGARNSWAKIRKVIAKRYPEVPKLHSTAINLTGLRLLR